MSHIVIRDIKTRQYLSIWGAYSWTPELKYAKVFHDLTPPGYLVTQNEGSVALDRVQSTPSWGVWASGKWKPVCEMVEIKPVELA